MNITMRRDFYSVQRSWTIDVLLDRRLTAAECRVAVLWVQKHVNRRTEDAFASQRCVANELGLSAKTVQRAIEKLEKFCYVEKAGYHGRARRLKMIRHQYEADDSGPKSPMSSQADVDVGHSEAPKRTPESAETGHRSPTNHISKPVEPATEKRGATGNRVAGVNTKEHNFTGSLEEMSEWQQRQLMVKWEAGLLDELRKDGSVSAMILIRDVEKLDFAFQLERGQITLKEAAADFRSRANNRRNRIR